ncbi:MAG: hypothetical protein IT182_04435 [Acidobacteria bacterium]|nr:hypothetical protein [Acidobacteriota bacterium]
MRFMPHRLVTTVLPACVVVITAAPLAAQDGRVAASPPPVAAAGRDVAVDRFVDRVWIVAPGSGVPEGTRYIFLSDNTLLIAAANGTTATGTWAEDLGGLVITEKGPASSRGSGATGGSSKVEVLSLTADSFRLRIAGPRGPTEISLRPAITPPAAPATTAVDPTAAGAATAPPRASVPAPSVAPLGSPYRCGADAFRVAFENNKAYVTWPDGSVLVLDETKVPDAPASRRTYSDGEYRVVEDTSEVYTRVLFARPGFRPRPCTPAR